MLQPLLPLFGGLAINVNKGGQGLPAVRRSASGLRPVTGRKSRCTQSRTEVAPGCVQSAACCREVTPVAPARRQCHARLMQAVEQAATDARAAVRCARCLTLINDFAKCRKVCPAAATFLSLVMASVSGACTAQLIARECDRRAEVKAH